MKSSNFHKSFIFLLFWSMLVVKMVLSQPYDFNFERIEKEVVAGSNNCIFQDSKGFVWLGTWNGLCRYDGFSFKLYEHNEADTSTLSDGYITSICEDNDGYLWVGTQNGLNRFNPSTGKCIRFYYNQNDSNSLSHSFITTLFFDKKNTLWIGTEPGYLNTLDLNPDLYKDNKCFKFIPYNLNNGKKGINNTNRINAITEHLGSGIDLLLVGTNHGLFTLNKTELNSERHLYSYKNNKFNSAGIFCFYKDAHNNIWAGGTSGRVTKLKIKSEKVYISAQYNLKTKNSISTIQQDSSGNTWIGTISDGLFCLKSEANKIDKIPSSEDTAGFINDEWIYSILVDRTGIVWISSRSALNKLDPHEKQFKSYPIKAPKDLWILAINGICEDDSGALWVSTYGRGLIKIDSIGGHETNYIPTDNRPSSLSSRWIHSLFCDSFGSVWIGSSAGLDKYDPATDSFIHFKIQSFSDFVYKIFEDRHANLWVASSGGISKLDRKTGRFKHYLTSPDVLRKLGGYWGDIIEYSEDQFLIGGKGLILFNSVTGLLEPFLINHDEKATYNSDMIFCLKKDKNNNIWIAGFEGLYKLMADKQVIKYTQANGLPSNHVYGLLEDDYGDLWITTFKGLVKYQEQNETFTTYSLNGDFLENEFAQGHLYKAKDGRLYIGQAQRFIFFNPNEIQKNKYSAPAMISGISLFGEAISYNYQRSSDEPLHFNHTENMLSFHFTTLNYTNASQNRFAYKLENAHDQWIYPQSKRFATYSNLEPGNYTFRVKSANDDGVWNEKGSSINIYISPPWWKTNWAYGIYIMILVGIILYLMWLNAQRQKQKWKEKLLHEKELNQLKEAEHRAEVAELQAKATEAEKETEKETMRSRIANDLHDEIGSNLSSIAIIGEVLEKRLSLVENDKKRLHKIKHIAQLTAESIRDIVWFVNPENDSIEKLKSKMREVANLMLEVEKIDFQVSMKNTFKTDVNFRRNLYLIYKEILQNIVRHSKASKVRISLVIAKNELVLEVEDNGIGFDTKKENTGNGLRNFQIRARELKGEITINSDLQKGTTILLKVKYPDHGIV